MSVLIDLLAEGVVSDGEQDGGSDVLREVDLSGDHSVRLSIGLHLESISRDDVSDRDTDLRAADCSLSGHSDGDFRVLIGAGEGSVDGEQGVAG